MLGKRYKINNNWNLIMKVKNKIFKEMYKNNPKINLINQIIVKY